MTAFEHDDIPFYLRLRGMIAASILDGRYGEGDQLPSVRAFAADAGANPLTVAKAYQCLQDEGHVSVRRGVGMFVADGAVTRLRTQERDLFLTKVWPQMRTHIARLGIDPEVLVERTKV
jgi:GntR family transcriptional regulator